LLRLTYVSRIDCKNRRGSYSKGRKVTGIEFFPDSIEALITTNDNRLRIINLEVSVI